MLPTHDETLHTALRDVAARRVVFHSGQYGPAAGWHWEQGGDVPASEFTALELLHRSGLIVFVPPPVAGAVNDCPVRLTPPGQWRLDSFETAHRAEAAAGAR